MKKYIIVALITIVAFKAKSQKLEKPVIDKITGDTTLSIKEQVLANKFTLIGHYLAGNIIKQKSLYNIFFHLKDGLDIHYHVLQGDKAIIKFSNGKLLEILAAEDVHSSLIGYAKPPVTESFIPFYLGADDIETLKNNGKITVIRIMTSKGAFDYDISNGKSEIIKKQLELITKK